MCSGDIGTSASEKSLKRGWVQSIVRPFGPVLSLYISVIPSFLHFSPLLSLARAAGSRVAANEDTTARTRLQGHGCKHEAAKGRLRGHDSRGHIHHVASPHHAATPRTHASCSPSAASCPLPVPRRPEAGPRPGSQQPGHRRRWPSARPSTVAALGWPPAQDLTLSPETVHHA